MAAQGALPLRPEESAKQPIPSGLRWEERGLICGSRTLCGHEKVNSSSTASTWEDIDMDTILEEAEGGASCSSRAAVSAARSAHRPGRCLGEVARLPEHLWLCVAQYQGAADSCAASAARVCVLLILLVGWRVIRSMPKTELAALRKQIQQLSRPKMLDGDTQSPPQQDGGPKESDLQKKQKMLEAAEAAMASLENAAQVQGVAPSTVPGYADADKTVRDLRQETHAAKPIGTQVHGIGKKIQKADQQIAKLQASIEHEKKAVADKLALLVDLKQQLEAKQKARVQLQLEQMELLRQRTPEQGMDVEDLRTSISDNGGTPAETEDEIRAQVKRHVESFQALLAKKGEVEGAYFVTEGGCAFFEYVVGSIYLDTKDGMGAANAAHLWQTVQALAELSSAGIDWMDYPLWQLVPRLPKELPQEAPIGCARFPLEWDQGLFGAADDAAGLVAGMDALMHGIEKELTNRYDHVGPAAKRCAGRAGAPEFVWGQVERQPPLKRTYKRPITLAWKTAPRWMMHIQTERDRLKTLVSQLQMASASCSIEPRQCSVLLQAFSEVSGFLRKARRSQVVLQQLPSEVQSFLGSGLQVLVDTRFQELMTMIGKEATRLRKEDQRDSYQAWMRFQREAFKPGASIAHRLSKVRPMDQIVSFRRPGGVPPQALANQVYVHLKLQFGHFKTIRGPLDARTRCCGVLVLNQLLLMVQAHKTAYLYCQWQGSQRLQFEGH
ncbi:unnamed protein product [Prorocentrum cordatum]|uniref:Uncharacterized protein n=1 Tax=Prorocentrum cordatum TaxID=2364126 RepID=A0ABN9UX52_9DINO|nr:unnamed protein product [Polarella glacialis]